MTILTLKMTVAMATIHRTKTQMMKMMTTMTTEEFAKPATSSGTIPL
jgi:hypothetical protein